jgi:hypothetical protein
MTSPSASGRWPMILGGIKAVEDALSEEGPHVHGHFLLMMRYMNPEAQDELWQEWTKAVRMATRAAMGIPFPQTFEVIRPDLREVTKKTTDDSRGLVSMDDALDEVCKYLTKPLDLLTPHVNRAGRQVNPPPADVLLGLAMVERWPRMVELLGAARKRPEPAQRPPLDTSCISVPAVSVPLPEFWEEGAIEPEERCDYKLKCAEASSLGAKIKRTRPPSWRQLMFSLGLHDWLQVVAARVRDGIRYRRNFLRSYNPDLDLWTLAGERIKAEVWPEECYS